MNVNLIMKRGKKSHKGDNGRVLVVGGSKDYIGAVALAGISALRAGSDLVVIAAPSKVAWAVNCLYPDLITKKFDCEYFSDKEADKIVKLSEGFDVVLIGNGISLKSKSFCKKIIKRIKKLKVIDADAVKAISIKDVDDAVITPHRKEFEIFLKNSKLKKLSEIRKVIGTNVILLKSPEDWIISKTKVKINKTGNAGMTKAGTGDVLAGLVAGFLSQSKDLFKSASAGAYINGKIGDLLLKKKKGYSFIASDMVEEIRKVLKR
jgi:NAD(P)H-hydrate epimerase